MSTKFDSPTPPPWEVGCHPALPNACIIRPVMLGSRVRVLPKHEGGHVIILNPHDAHLMAAAPEMLSELESILEWATTENAPLRDKEIESIRAVIKKAKGGESCNL